MPLRHFKETQNAGAIGAPLGGNRANPGKHPRGNSGAISGAIGPPPGGNWDPQKTTVCPAFIYRNVKILTSSNIQHVDIIASTENDPRPTQCQCQT